MKLLKVDKERGLFLDGTGAFQPVDKIVKEDLLRLVNLTLGEEDVEFDEYDDKALPNHAHQVIYKSVVQKLQELKDRKREFLDQSERLFLDAYEKYGGKPGK